MKIPTIFKAFCDENRVKILKLLLTGEKCACVLLDDMHITQPTLSHHMKILCDSGIVIGRKREMDALLYFREWRAVCNRLSTSAYDYKCSI